MSGKVKYYLAYGSNLNVEQMKVRCPEAKIIGTTTIAGYRLLFKGSKTGAYLTIEKMAGREVPVAVWAVNEADERSLDRYEGYPTFYYKQKFRVAAKLTDGTSAELGAFAYIMHEDRKLGVPSAWYVRGCLEGYSEFGFDSKYIWEAYRESGGELYEMRNKRAEDVPEVREALLGLSGYFQRG